MPRIRLRWFYTNVVEHFFRMGVRYDEVKGVVDKQWLDFTKNWIDSSVCQTRNICQAPFLSSLAVQFWW